jgi:hypothetical protein
MAWNPSTTHELIGGNFRLDEIQAAVLNVKLPHLDAWSAAACAQRRVLRRRPLRAPGSARTCARRRAPRPGARHIYNPVLHPRRTARTPLRHQLAEHGIGTEIYYPLALHMQQCFAYLGHSRRISRSRCAPPARRWRCRSTRSCQSRNFNTLSIPSRACFGPEIDTFPHGPRQPDRRLACAAGARRETRAVSCAPARRRCRARQPLRARGLGLYFDFSRQRIDDDGCAC